MRTTVDRAGRVIVPKPIRDQVGLVAGAELEVGVRDGRIEMEPVGPGVRLEKQGRRMVFVTDEEVPALTVEEVRALLEQLRR